MSSILKPFILVFLLSFSVCEKSRIKRAPQGILPPITDIICGCPEPQTCPEPTTCPETPTCPEPTAPPTCPVRPQELCSDAYHSYYCAYLNECITTRFAARNASAAKDKCSSLSNENVSFGARFFPGFGVSRETMKCLSVALPPSGLHSNERLWAFIENNCMVYGIETNGKDQMTNIRDLEQVPCTGEHPFFCVGRFNDGA
ncbi:UNVERIFIED_CONTAM: hypothetical protein RMT77_013692 [Armadillidium vulgare]